MQRRGDVQGELEDVAVGPHARVAPGSSYQRRW